MLNGRLVYTHRICSGKSADRETLEAIDLVNAELAEEMPPPPPVKPPPPVTPTPTPPPPVKPPVAMCTTAGVPLFEIKHRVEIAIPTWTSTVYASGAWTYQPIDKDGHLGALTMGDRKSVV